MITRYGAIANGAGVAYTPHFLISALFGKRGHAGSEQIIDNTDAIAPLTDMLVGVVENGTAKRLLSKAIRRRAKPVRRNTPTIRAPT